jgi:hypothetical protein
MSVIDGFNLYDKSHEISKKVEDTSKEFWVCFITSSAINYNVLSKIHLEFGEECYVSKEVFINILIL